ncbi:helix-turn-helix domain-containing protein [Bacillus pseudomycoides]|uniref:Helix-turn-helix domain-containing protein n=1 Tax=Bacillus bingmayongensis TaxID=1150157 RepID=A0ABU5JQP3_9BACI|nr:helix-turn-helix domain-containing protein [Bacillus pseudomycoides]
MNNSIDIQYLCDLIYKTFHVPIYFLSIDNKILYSSTDIDTCIPFYPSTEKCLGELYQEGNLYDFPLFKGTCYLENFILIRIENHEVLKGTFIVGPTTYPKVSHEMVIKLLGQYNSNVNIPDGIAYYDSIPVMKKGTLLHIGILLHYMIFKEKLDIGTVWKENKLIEETPYKSVNPDLYILKRRQANQNDYNISLEKQFFSAVTEGNKKKLIEYAYSFPQEDAGILSIGNQLRNQKHNGIIAITLAARYAIEGNLPSHIAFSLSTLYIQTLEQLDNMYAVNRLIEDALCSFADHVKEYNTEKYSGVITTCLNYISKNIYQDIYLSDLADFVGVNPSYLSTLFKKEVKITFSGYIQRMRVEEAKKLLTLTTYSLLDICVFLNFNDQSYFTRIFKKITNMTPKQYRQTHTVI